MDAELAELSKPVICNLPEDKLDRLIEFLLYAFLRNVLTVVAVIVFCVFIWQHSGLTARAKYEQKQIMHEVQTYEFERQTSRDNNRTKELVPIKVVYRYVTR